MKNLTGASAHTETYICISKYIGRESIGISYLSKVDPGEGYGLYKGFGSTMYVNEDSKYTC